MTEKTENVSPWVTAAQSIARDVRAAAPEEDHAPAAEDQPVGFVAAHGGAGATAWASILDGTDHGPQLPADGTPVVLVARASLHGIDAAKAAIAAHGRAAFSAVLTVPAVPGRTPRLIQNELKVLAGAVHLVPAPWVPGLLIKRSALADFTDVPAKDLAKVRAALSITKGEMK
ncbi:hypothetical protein [Arthrobacter sp. BE255]|uniref:hypothetical protein n=1 Tax=Arthrobacter sp. BE255 TaxID=2817721 RepID=UPI00285AEFD3|nr:hypothetical protein [Arthrobacter sp. BE255]MDR7161744.1 hypothetical protein [Arthrobacter sp. BE255]